MPFTLVSTIFNEEKRLNHTIADLEAQSVQPSEIIITDAGSTDNSWGILAEWKKRSKVPIVLLQEKGCNVARGRNLAIEKAKCEIIVSTDFGCRFDPRWFESLIQMFTVNSDTQVVGGAYGVLETDTINETAKAGYILTNGYHIKLDDYFIPSSRSIAFKKEIWEKIGGYCEWLTLAADDLVFGLELKAQGIPIHLVKEPLVFWGRHTTRKQYAKEAYRYGLGDGEARVNFRNFIIATAEWLLRFWFVFIVLAALLFIFWNKSTVLSFGLIFLSSIGLFGFRPYIRAFKNWLNLRSKKYNLKTLAIAIIMLEEQRWSYTRGYLKGFFFSSPEVKEQAKKLQKKLKQPK